MIPRVEPEGMLFGKPLHAFPDHALSRIDTKTKAGGNAGFFVGRLRFPNIDVVPGKRSATRDP